MQACFGFEFCKLSTVLGLENFALTFFGMEHFGDNFKEVGKKSNLFLQRKKETV